MPLIKGTNLQSNEIGLLTGFDGTESRETVKWARKYEALFPSRIVIALNQNYPELRSGAYLNRHLIALIQEAFAQNGLHVVIQDNYQKDGIVPEELTGGLDVADDYLLVDELLEVRGRLNVWESLGGKGKFYHDRFILEVLTSASVASELTRCIEDKCRAYSVTVRNP